MGPLKEEGLRYDQKLFANNKLWFRVSYEVCRYG